MKNVCTKKELASTLGISSNTLRRWMNRKFFDVLAENGYEKTDRILKPKVRACICDLLDIEV